MTYLPFTTKHTSDTILLTPHPIIFSSKKHHSLAVYLRSGFTISKAKFKKEPKLHGSEEEIIKQIHDIRFNEKNPYVITGGHFDQLFVRNLGIFFNALLDPRITTSHEDWTQRQEITLKTIALDLEVFKQAGKDYTTIVHVKNNIFTGYNFYTRPSDSLFAILYALCALTDDDFIGTVFPAKKLIKKKLQTQKAAKELYDNYKETLKHLIKTYLAEIIDEKTGLVKKTITLASARDGIKRESSFYDNVIAWATIRLAKKLQLYSMSDKEFETWKKRIVKTFWDEKEGIFLDDLSKMSLEQKLFSADSFIVTSTGFLDFSKNEERKYLSNMVTYVQKKRLDTPFPLHYSRNDVPYKLYWQVRYFAPTYMGTSIWSHWGMEYIKALIYVGQFSEAKKQLDRYKQNIERYGGYPELYDSNGNILNSRLYHSVLHNGWVINYEQTKMLYDNLVSEE